MINSISIVLPNYITRLIGGAELQSYFLAEELLKRGAKVNIISSYFIGADKNNNPQYKNNKINYLFYKQSSLISLSFLHILWLLFKTKTDIYYVRTDYPHVGAVGLFTLIMKKRMVYACADNECGLKNRYSRQLKRSDYSNTFKYLVRKLDWFLVDRMIEFGKKRATHIIAQTSLQKEQMFLEFGKKCQIIPNSFKILHSNGISKEDIVLWVGNLRAIKQPEIFCNLSEVFSNSNYRFIIIGEKNNEYEDFPKISGHNFEYIGKHSLEETEKWIARARFIVNTSVSEGFSNTFIQAWFYKTYILSLNADPDFLFSIENFGWCAQGNYNAMVLHLENLMKAPEQVSESLNRALVYANSNFSVESNVNLFEKYINT